METPKKQVSWLESFPPDIWACFVWYLPGEQLGRLKMTGATFVRHRLKSPHVVKSINLGLDFIVFKSFPRFLNDFPSIEELYIHSTVRDWSIEMGLRIDSVPSGVTKLELSGDWDLPADTLFGENGATLKLNEHLPRLMFLDLNGLLFKNSSWMTHSPQSLTTLKLRSWDGTVELPTSLIHFEAGGIDLSTSSFVSKLPPSLESLNVEILYGVELIVPLLPTSTRKLNLGHYSRYSDGPKSPQNLLEQLPKSLTFLVVPDSTGINFVTNPGLISLLPSTLTELHITPILPCSLWHLLPQQLTTLSLIFGEPLCTVASKTIDSDAAHHELKSLPTDSLPKSITKLDLHGPEFVWDLPATYNRSYFPPHLTWLQMDDIQLSPETAKLLPSSLTFLELRSLCERVCKHLPASLKTLKSRPVLITPNLIKFLPKSLTSIHCSSSENSWHFCNPEGNLSLPNFKEDSGLKNSSHMFDWTDHSPLPSTLTELKIYGANHLGDAFLQHQQLANLIELNLGQSKHFTDLSIPLLSPHLKLLNLGRSIKISGRSFQYLSRSLTHLDLSGSESIFDSDIQHLPRTLKHALFSSAVHLTDSCVSDLPPHLEILDMQLNSKIPTSCFPKLPYSLRSCQVSTSAIFANWAVYSGVLKATTEKESPMFSEELASFIFPTNRYRKI